MYLKGTLFFRVNDVVYIHLRRFRDKKNLMGHWRWKMKLGYIRVSTLDQNIDRQEVLMKDLGVDKIFIDRCSGKNTNRAQLQEMMQFARSGDVVIVESISRFARNTKDLLNLIDQLVNKDVQFVSKKEAIDTTTPTGRFMLTVFGAVSELEREYILQRQKEGIAIARQKGKYKGRSRLDDSNFDAIYKLWINKQISGVDARRKLGYSKSTFYRRVKEKQSNE